MFVSLSRYPLTNSQKKGDIFVLDTEHKTSRKIQTGLMKQSIANQNLSDIES